MSAMRLVPIAFRNGWLKKTAECGLAPIPVRDIRMKTGMDGTWSCFRRAHARSSGYIITMSRMTRGFMGKGRSASITFRDENGVHFVLAHVRDIAVEEGQQVMAGDPVAKFGNNGYSRSPHVHIGAWKGEQPLQIRWDQSRMKLAPEFRD